MNAPALAWLRLTVLVENTSQRDDLVGEHGFAALLETDRGVVLFDTGASNEALASNARALDVDLGRVEAIVLSHGHYDHTGGVAAAGAAAPQATVYAHDELAAPRWARRFGVSKAIGVPKSSAAMLARRGPIQAVDSPVVLPQGVCLSGTVYGQPSAAQRGFFAERRGRPVPDPFDDELFVLARPPAGWALVSGCCHRGVRNTLRHARGLTGGEPIRTVIGGLHLRRTPKRGLDALLPVLDDAGVEELLIGHCTGERAIRHFERHASARVERLAVGFCHSWHAVRRG